MMGLDGKTAIVTGGAAGIGRAACLTFARAGARVLVVDRDGAEGEATAQLVREAGGDAFFVQADVSRSADVQAYVAAAMDRYWRIDCFFNNAGIEGRVAFTADYDEAVFDAVLAVNVKGVFLGLKYVIPVMVGGGGGAIVNTASTAGVSGSPGLSGYVASKHAVIGLTRTAAVEYGGRGVRVNAVCPGPTATRMIASLESQTGAGANDPGERLRATIPIGRYAEAAEIADLVLFLCSDLSRSINGAQYLIDGVGQRAQPRQDATKCRHRSRSQSIVNLFAACSCERDAPSRRLGENRADP